ncbi:50S ribosomal protein L25 [Patescibacteria group bacterium]|nr:50S ribosomal protein L25 [Patescibacteria group bacterium]MBU1721197.1 50S ribosomal protein L25 [Patescibacteria group bacterium]MBU1901095.1 50S ribosomal protein L25 [Patescibacteria group bacterium]
MSISLAAKKREGNSSELRAEGQIPAVVYGPHIESFSVAVPYVAFSKLFDDCGESTIIELDIEGGEKTPVLIQDLQIDPIKRTFTHIDFRHVTMGEAMEVSVELVLEGVAPAEKMLGGNLSKGVDSITVKTMPKDLVDSITVDISVLATFDDSITLGDVVLPEGMTLVDAPDTLVAKVSAPMTQEQLDAREEGSSVSVADIKVEEKGKKEEAAAE